MKKYFSTELCFWLIALAYLALINPDNTHFSFCIFKYFGILFCPGCGIGHSISYLLHGDIANSWNTHILGTFALLIIVYRVLQLTIKNKNYGKSISNA